MNLQLIHISEEKISKRRLIREMNLIGWHEFKYT